MLLTRAICTRQLNSEPESQVSRGEKRLGLGGPGLNFVWQELSSIKAQSPIRCATQLDPHYLVGKQILSQDA